jgi:hypothetical protein
MLEQAQSSSNLFYYSESFFNAGEFLWRKGERLGKGRRWRKLLLYTWSPCKTNVREIREPLCSAIMKAAAEKSVKRPDVLQIHSVN